LKKRRVLGLKVLSEYMLKQLNSRSKMYDYSSQIIHIDNEDFETFDDDDDNDEIINDSNSDDDIQKKTCLEQKSLIQLNLI
jgi:hypothetical protein